MRFVGLIALVGVVASSCLFAGNSSGGSRHKKREPAIEKHHPREREGVYRRPQEEFDKDEASTRALESSLKELFQAIQTINSGRGQVQPTN